jgi:uncharacterized protein (TIGR03083 family)
MELRMSTAAVEAVRIQVDEVRPIVEALTPEEWERPSRCPGWRVQDLVAHMSSNFREVVHPSPPPPEPPQLPAEALMELLVEPRRSWPPQQVRDEWLEHCDEFVERLAALQHEPVASTLTPIADLGTYPLHTLADAFAFDLYCHVRIDLLAPEGPIRRALPPAGGEQLGPAIGWMLTGLPQMQPDLHLSVAPGAPLRLELSGPGGGSWLVRRHGSGLAVDRDGGGEVATISSAGHAFVMWGTKRAPWREHCSVTGDSAAAAAFLDALNIV